MTEGDSWCVALNRGGS